MKRTRISVETIAAPLAARVFAETSQPMSELFGVLPTG
jgi:hypothetical protein